MLEHCFLHIMAQYPINRWFISDKIMVNSHLLYINEADRILEALF